MPELAEVDYYRRRWDPGLNKKILRVHLHGEKRIFRGTDPEQIKTLLTGKVLLSSESRGKQIVFRSTDDVWLGIHLGMTGELRCLPPTHTPEKHDHLVLFQKENALVLNDFRQFGRVRFAQSKEEPSWWAELKTNPSTPDFSLDHVTDFIRGHPKPAIKGVLLMQRGFPGIGNWMADEILWRAKIAPARPANSLSETEIKTLWKQTRYVTEHALNKIKDGLDNLPKNWLFHQRWSKEARCPKHKSLLRKEVVAGRTTAWCELCQH